MGIGVQVINYTRVKLLLGRVDDPAVQKLLEGGTFVPGPWVYSRTKLHTLELPKVR
jgi:hypothetical protein